MKSRRSSRLMRRTYPVIGFVLTAAVVLAVVSVTLSPVVEQTLPPVSPAVTVTVAGIPPSAHAGDVFRLTATLKNNANRPLPTVLRMDVRNLNTTLTTEDLTVYAGCGAEEPMSTRTIRYYIGSHGPLLAPNGTGFPAGVTVATVEGALGGAGHWDVVLREIETRDPEGYASLIAPGRNASLGVQGTASPALKALAYFGMVASDLPSSGNPADWRLVAAFVDTWIPGDVVGMGFVIELAPTIRGGFEFELWAELPDGLGVPSHPKWTCSPL